MTHEPQTATERKPSKFWTPEQDAMITVAWAQGSNAREIGRKVSKSRNAVIGRIHRLALPSRDTGTLTQRQRAGHLHAGLKYKTVLPPAPKLSPEEKAAMQARRKALQAERNTTTARIRVMNGAPQRPSLALREPPPHDGPSYDILHVPRHGCKYAVTGHNVARDEHRFCGRPAVGATPWCGFHGEIVIKPMEGRG